MGALLLLLAATMARGVAAPPPPGTPDTFAVGWAEGFDEGAAAATATPSGGAQTVVYYPGYEGRTCYRVPSLLTVGESLFAFAESRHGLACANDDCIPLNPVEGDNRTATVLRTSSDGGRSWGPMVDLCRDGVGGAGCADYEATYDDKRKRLVVQYATGDPTLEDTPPFAANRRNWPAHHVFQVTSSDLGKSWSAPMPLAKALAAVEAERNCGEYCDLLVGPGRGLQLHSAAKGRAGRLLFCGHRTDPTLSRISPIWWPAASTSQHHNRPQLRHP